MITAITVAYNTHDLLKRAYESFRKFHPDMPLIIVDNSDAEDRCAWYVDEIERTDENLLVLHPDGNIGHGAGMDMAIKWAPTPYALIFDSDVEIIESPVGLMYDMMEPDTYGVGLLEETGLDGYEYGVHGHHKNEEHMKYLHPFFQLISVARYREFYPYVHHGAPCYLAMLDIHKRGLSDKILKQVPRLGHTGGGGYNWKGDPTLPYVKHDTRGTRDVRTAAHQGEIEPGWVLNRGKV